MQHPKCRVGFVCEMKLNCERYVQSSEIDKMPEYLLSLSLPPPNYLSSTPHSIPLGGSSAPARIKDKMAEYPLQGILVLFYWVTRFFRHFFFGANFFLYIDTSIVHTYQGTGYSCPLSISALHPTTILNVYFFYLDRFQSED